MRWHVNTNRNILNLVAGSSHKRWTANGKFTVAVLPNSVHLIHELLRNLTFAVFLLNGLLNMLPPDRPTCTGLVSRCFIINNGHSILTLQQLHWSPEVTNLSRARCTDRVLGDARLSPGPEPEGITGRIRSEAAVRAWPRQDCVMQMWEFTLV